MGVDNNAILFLGCELTKEVEKKIVGDLGDEDKEYFENTPDEFWVDYYDEPFSTQLDNAYDPKTVLVGCEIANSGAYSIKEIDYGELVQGIGTLRDKFVTKFGIEPTIYLLNYMW